MLDPLIALFQDSPATFYTTVVLFGLAVGSFLNVVILRLPVMMQRDWRQQCTELLGRDEEPGSTADSADQPFNLLVPRSRCPQCGHQIGATENLPIISYLLQKGRCKHCSTSISIRYPTVELITALLSVAVAWHFGVTLQSCAALLLTWALIALTVIDIDHTLLPDSITLPFMWIGIGCAMFSLFTDLQSSVIGALLGYLSLWSIYQLFKLITGKEGMGYGDFKLLALLGAWLGWQQLPTIILLSSVVGAVVGISMIALRNHQRSTPIPFGPYLATAGWIALLWGEPIADAYLTWALSS